MHFAHQTLALPSTLTPSQRGRRPTVSWGDTLHPNQAPPPPVFFTNNIPVNAFVALCQGGTSGVAHAKRLSESALTGPSSGGLPPSVPSAGRLGAVHRTGALALLSCRRPVSPQKSTASHVSPPGPAGVTPSGLHAREGVPPGPDGAEDAAPDPAEEADLHPLPARRVDCYGLLHVNRLPSSSVFLEEPRAPRPRRRSNLSTTTLDLYPQLDSCSVLSRDTGTIDLHSARQHSSCTTQCGDFTTTPSDPHVPRRGSCLSCASKKSSTSSDSPGTPSLPVRLACYRSSTRSLPALPPARDVSSPTQPASPTASMDTAHFLPTPAPPPEGPPRCGAASAEAVRVMLWVLLPSFLGVLLVGVLVGTVLNTRAPGSVLWALQSQQGASVHTTCQAWQNATACPAPVPSAGVHDAQWTGLHPRAGGSVAIGSYEPICSALYMALILTFHLLLFRGSWGWVSWAVSGGLCLARTGAALAVWWFSDPLSSDLMPLLGGMIVTLMLECLGHNALRPPAHRIMRSCGQVARGLLALSFATILPYCTWYVMGALMYGGVSVNSYAVLFGSTFVFGSVSVLQSLLFARLPHFPIEACLLLRYSTEVGLLFPRRQYISSLDTNKEVVLASLVSSLGELGKGVVVAVCRKWRAQRAARAGDPTDVERQHALDAAEVVSSIVGEQVSVWASFVGNLVLDPLLFSTVGPPTHRHTLLGACGIFLVQEAFELVSDAGILLVVFLLHRTNRLPFNELRRAPGFRWAVVGTTLAVCGVMASVGFTIRWGCLSCLLRAQGYVCDTACHEGHALW